uniref:DDE Tnp4 domain-containing protein n=1 Tax=Hordeum vulgare subsp. vulgare TaxID=112509 RepID=A0A8I7B485_HORVV
MVVCDFDLNFTFISCGWEGSETDARVLRSALKNGFQVPPDKFYLVDGGYANTPYFLAPYRGVRYHLKEFAHGRRRPQNHRELFNHRHAVLRNHIERA